jgi:beta-galactosidase
VDGYPTAEATLQVPAVPPGQRTTVTLPDDLVSPGDGETWLTVQAKLAAPTPWADQGHEVALGQFELTVPSTITTLPAWPARPTRQPMSA